jgi:hypothetical protein
MCALDLKKTIDLILTHVLPCIANLMLKASEDEVLEEGFLCLSKIQTEISMTVSLPFDNIISEFQQEADKTSSVKQYRLRLTTLRLLTEYGNYINNYDLSKFADWCTILK